MTISKFREKGIIQSVRNYKYYSNRKTIMAGKTWVWKSGSAVRKQNGQEMGPWHHISRFISRVLVPPMRLHYINVLQASKTILATEEMVYKHMSLWVTLLFKPQQCLYIGLRRKMSSIPVWASTGNTKSTLLDKCSGLVLLFQWWEKHLASLNCHEIFL